MTSRQFFSDVQKNVSRQIMFTKPPLFILPSVPKYNTIHSSTYITNYMNLCNIVYIGTYAQYIYSDWIDRIVCLHYWNSSELVVCWNVCSVHVDICILQKHPSSIHWILLGYCWILFRYNYKIHRRVRMVW